jgi:hypothetical protein
VSDAPARPHGHPPALLDHAAFVASWRAGEIEIAVDPHRAAGLISSRLLLPHVTVAVIGVGIGLTYWGWPWAGIAIGALAIVAARLIRRSAAGMVLQQVEHDAELYRQAVACGAVTYRQNETATVA